MNAKKLRYQKRQENKKKAEAATQKKVAQNKPANPVTPSVPETPKTDTQSN